MDEKKTSNDPQASSPESGKQGRTLACLVGNMWVPTWAVRPGSYRVLAPLAACMPLWMLLHSRTGDYFHPCYANREQLGATLGIAKAKVSRQLAQLRRAGLLFEVERGKHPATRQHRPPARFALDPFTVERWRPKVETSLARIRDDDPQNGRWLHNAVTALEAFERRSRILGAHIGEDMPFLPTKRGKKRGGGQEKRLSRSQGPK